MTRRVAPIAKTQAAQNQRIDKWLWFARLVKTRTLGTRLVTGGKIRINREKVDKASQAVKIGDIITASIARRIMVLEVLDFGVRRGPASEAVGLYKDITPPELSLKRTSGPGHKRPRLSAFQGGKVAERLPGSGRPSKRERRQLNKLRDSDD